MNALARSLFLACTITTAFLAGCAAPPPPAPPPVASSTQPAPFAQAIEQATDALLSSVPQPPKPAAGLFAGTPVVEKRRIAIDASVDAASGQQTTATQQLDQSIVARAAQRFGESFAVQPLEQIDTADAQFLLTGSMTRDQKVFRIDLALVDLRAGTIVARGSSVALGQGVDVRPLAFYRDSPVLMRDRGVDAQVRTAGGTVGSPADALYLERVAQARTLEDAMKLYHGGQYREALAAYQRVAATPGGDQIRVLNGIYLSNVRLGQQQDAEAAFGRLVAYGIRNNQLGVKFLFSPGGIDFWDDPKISSPYTMWLRQIARSASQSRVCLDIVGHTSATGSDSVNDNLSLRRANYIRSRLTSESRELGPRSHPVGMGSRQNIVGTGSDDVVDAPDRRVEFKIVECRA